VTDDQGAAREVTPPSALVVRHAHDVCRSPLLEVPNLLSSSRVRELLGGHLVPVLETICALVEDPGSTIA
jgi:hypothetical protein